MKLGDYEDVKFVHFSCNIINNILISKTIFSGWYIRFFFLFQCSKKNGKGIQSRIARCIPPENESFYNCDGPTVKTEIRSCTGHVTRAIEFPSRCLRDKNRFCSIPSLKRYCNVVAFRKRCCRSCENFDSSNSFDRERRMLQTWIKFKISF